MFVNFTGDFASLFLFVKWEISGRKHAELIDRRFEETFREAYDQMTKLHDYFSRIVENITSDDVKLVVFCQSCKENRFEPSFPDVTHQNDPVIFLLYNNGIPFQVSIFTYPGYYSSVIERVESMRKKVADDYTALCAAEQQRALQE